jgi:hypothetical protein
MFWGCILNGTPFIFTFVFIFIFTYFDTTQTVSVLSYWAFPISPTFGLRAKSLLADISCYPKNIVTKRLFVFLTTISYCCFADLQCMSRVSTVSFPRSHPFHSSTVSLCLRVQLSRHLQVYFMWCVETGNRSRRSKPLTAIRHIPEPVPYSEISGSQEGGASGMLCHVVS